MSVLKKIASLLFEETETEVLAEDELEPIEIKEKPKPKSKDDRIHEHESYSAQTNHSMDKSTYQATASSKLQEEEKKFVSIDLEEKPKVKPIEKVVEPSRKKHVKQVYKEEKREFEFSPVISPIFGSKEESTKTKKKSVIVAMSRTKKKNPLGTIISPYYGIGELEEFEAEAQEKIEEKEKIKKEGLPVEMIEKLDMEEEIKSMPLEELIDETSVNGDAEDLMQISLFGESTPIKETKDGIIKE